MKKNEMYVLSPEERHIPKVTVASLLDKYNLRELWNFADEVCDKNEFEKIAQLLVFYLSKKVQHDRDKM